MHLSTENKKSQQIFSGLIGKWSFRRSIVNTLQPKLSGHVQGIIDFATDTQFADRLNYHEAGTFKTIADLNLKTNKEFIYLLDSQKNIICVYSTFNRQPSALLYTLTFPNNNQNQEIVVQAIHQCNLDTYEVEYSFISSKQFSEFRIEQKVIGPKKNYCAVTAFTRL